MLIDTHCHLYEAVLNPDIKAVMQRSLDASVEKILVPNIDETSIAGLLEVCKAYPNNAFAMMGLHPCYVKKNYVMVLEKMETLFSQHRFIAVGEIGLDYYHDITFKQEQTEALEIQLAWAEEMDLPVSLHSRNATADLIQLLKKKSFNIKGVFHCFSESLELANQIIDLGFYIGIGGVLTFEKASIASMIKEIPLDKIILETDAPYLAPKPFRGKRNEPAYTKLIAEKLANIFSLPLDDIASITTANAERLFFKNPS